jgi:hypothetical protein
MANIEGIDVIGSRFGAGGIAMEVAIRWRTRGVYECCGRRQRSGDRVVTELWHTPSELVYRDAYQPATTGMRGSATSFPRNGEVGVRN